MERAADWARESALLEELISLPTEESRLKFLDERCGGDSGLRARLQTMAEGHFRSAFLASEQPKSSFSDPEPDLTGQTLGQYTVRSKLGEGGCGIAYMAEQEQPLRRQVALKILKLGMDTRSVIARFQLERQTLAVLNHPNIARIIDAGATASGRPYFVMELVPGEPITRFCDRHGLRLEARLRLFLQVCEAVQHAHQKGIIHRDLKPSNILVAFTDKEPLPKVIDFGVAKAAAGVTPEATLLTRGAHFLGTPAYMSPEQLSLSEDIDTRADVYALGVLLYELLAGRPPFDPKELERLPLDEMCRTLREAEPARPSRVSPAISRLSIPSDLDWIVMKCLEKERARRYPGVSGLAADIQRYLHNETVTARPPSRWYSARKTVERHRAAFVAAGFAILVLLLATLLTSWQAIRATRAEKEMERRVEALIVYADNILRKVHPEFYDLPGASRANEALLESTVTLMPQLNGSGTDNRKLQVLLARLTVRLGYAQGWGMATTAANSRLGYKNALEAIALLTELRNPTDLEIHTLVRAHLLAGYAATDLMKFEQALEHFNSMERLSGELMLSPNTHFQSEGAYHKRWAFGSRGVVYIEMGDGKRALEVSRRELEELRARNVAEATENEYDLLDLASTQSGLGEALQVVGNHSEAADAYGEALRFAEIGAERLPNKVSLMARIPIYRARWGESLWSSGEAEKGRQELDRALQELDNLMKRDTGRSGLLKLRIEVLVSRARALARSAALGDNPHAAGDLQEARDVLATADRLIRDLPPGSEMLTRHHLQQVQQLISGRSLK